MQKLLFFDIDGTIMLTHGAGRRVVEEALSEAFGKSIVTKGIPFGGKTDPQILTEVLVLHGIEPSEENISIAGEKYMDGLKVAMPMVSCEVLPGIPELLASLDERNDVELALLTGNFEPMAYLKLQKAGVEHYFHYGAFGSDHADRNALPEIGIQRAEMITGQSFQTQHIHIIGDTPKDIECARIAGWRVVAVATGNYSRDELATHQPDLLLENLRDHSPFWRYLDKAA
ncbi:MAG: HAD hydrolase-like protein [Bacteroidetes Order II. Incertae sedis bacterium]|nr:HAD hydrolase-like protein [Bacteroidetes Order II. bacterium]